MKTVIQKIGPLYGEAVNGSVFGQPNGSVAIVPKNEIVTIYRPGDSNYVEYVKNGSMFIAGCTQDGSISPLPIAKIGYQSQVEPTGWLCEMATDSAFANIVCSLGGNILQPSHKENIDLMGKTYDYTVVNGTTYYVRMKILYEGTTILTSETFTVTGVV